MIKVVSAFAGIEGFGLGLEKAGFKVICQIEKDKAALSILDRHYPDVMKIKDIHDATADSIPRCNVLTGGTPCQDVSTAGKRKGLAGSRSGLWFEFHRLIREIRPAWIIIENVPGLLSTHQGKDFATILGGLTGALPDMPDTGWKSAGAIRGARGFYHACWRILDAQYFGVPQRRRRVFIVANLTEAGGGCAEVLFESQSGTGHSQPRQKTGQTTTTTLNAVPPSRRNGSSDPTAGHFVVETLDVRNLELHDHSAPLQSKEQGYSLNFTNPIAFNYKAGNSVDQPVRQDGNAGTLQVAGSEAVYYGLNSELSAGENVLPNLQHDSETGGGHPSMVGYIQSGVRRLTPIECARLQGFPDDWCEGLSDSQQYRLYGNAVAVPMIKWIGQRLMQVILKQQGKLDE